MSALIDLACLIALLIIPWLMIARERSDKVTKRIPFAVSTCLTLFVVPPVVVFLGDLFEEPIIKIAINLLGFIVPATLYAREVVRRARDAGHGKKLPYAVFMIPVVNFLVVIYLMFAGSRDKTVSGQMSSDADKVQPTTTLD